MSKHTPGPWVTRGSLIKTMDELLIASAYPAEDSKETILNARLLASAPNLLAACKNLRLEYQRLCKIVDQGDSGHPWAELLQSILTKIFLLLI